ncbi:MAG: SUMF1/EgtB/PvdO family nonheme iron enzyme [Deltaproteobacteria bacterium]|nr:SUMF1/EgtB/PvdO family nonheme iron enzyme [Deltaproteobacteria bacterium]
MLVKSVLLITLAALSFGCAATHPPVNAIAPTGMALVPAGEFMMGNDATDPLERMGGIQAINEMPKRKVYVKAFYMDRYEVTNLEYKVFIENLKKGGVRALAQYINDGIPVPDHWSKETGTFKYGQERHPVIDVDWYMANLYCLMRGKRLPTEEEWEKAARGIDERIYPWGNEYGRDLAATREVCDDKGLHFNACRPFEVGSFKKDVSIYGISDMAGNAMEWTATRYAPYPGAPVANSVRFTPEENVMTLRGGAHDTLLFEFGRTTARHFRRATDMMEAHADWHTDMNVGFRCVMDAE